MGEGVVGACTIYVWVWLALVPYMCGCGWRLYHICVGVAGACSKYVAVWVWLVPVAHRCVCVVGAVNI